MKGILALGLFALIASSLPRHNRRFGGSAGGDPSLPGEKGCANATRSVVESAAKAFMGNQQTVGLSIGVFKDGKAFTYNFGTTERGKQRPPTAHTRYAIASITKTFTGSLLAQAVAEQKVRLDDDVRLY